MNLHEISYLIKEHAPEVKKIEISVVYDYDSKSGPYHRYNDYYFYDADGEPVYPHLKLDNKLSELFTNNLYINDVEWLKEDDEDYDEDCIGGSLTFDVDWNLID